jgi:hypothetical protein
VDLDRFDSLTRQLATGTSRRQVLKGIVTFAVGSILSQFGMKAYANDAGILSPSQVEDHTYLPSIRRYCPAASTYDDPVPCGPPVNGCLCVRTTEGDIRCGTAPCSAKECASSADCANLGADYFCDVPNSGRCDDPPTPPRSRCLAPCGKDYCYEGTTVCGDKCCTADQTCSEGTCISTYRCEISHVRLSDLRAALAALKAGETRVNLTPEGCIWYTQELVENKVVSRSMFIAEVEISRWTREGNQFIQQSDSDRDGFFEWRSTTTKGATPDQFTTVETEYAPSTQKLFRRTTLTPQGDLTRLVVEEANQAGTLVVVDDYTVPRVQGAKLTGDNLPDAELALDSALVASESLSLDSLLQGCEANPCNPEEIKKRMEESVDRGLQCFDDMGDPGLKLYEKTVDVIGRDFNITCAPIANFEATIEGWENADGPLNLTVDPAKYCKMDGIQRSWILFHEILHAAMQRPHDPAAEQLEEEHRKQMDRIYGCMGYCYNNENRPTKCMCAKCFNTTTCDPLCSRALNDCGATCPCPARSGQYYLTCDTCLALCPAGLSCFGWDYCDMVGHSPVCPPVTCP